MRDIFFVREFTCNRYGWHIDGLEGCNKNSDASLAIRDIKKGDEMVTDYESFDNEGALMWFDNLYEKVWGDFYYDDDDEDDDDDNEDGSKDTLLANVQ